MNPAGYVLQEIAGQESQGGARRGTIRTMVDGRQKLMLTDMELDGALAELTARRLIEQDGEVYRLSSGVRGRVPLSPSGSISMVRGDWERLTDQLNREGWPQGDLQMTTPTLESAIEASHKALAAILMGDQSGYLGLFSTAEDVTLGNPFGPFGRGRKNVEARLAIAASKYRDGRNAHVEPIEKYVAANLACVAEVESGEAKVAGSEEMTKISVRVTSVFRLEAGNWKLVHRHADPLSMPQ